MTVVEMQAELAAMLDPQDIPRSWTPRELEAYETRRRTLQSYIRIIQNATAKLAEHEPEIAALTLWRDHMVAWRQTLGDRLLASPQRPGTRAAEDIVLGLKLSIQAIDRNLDWDGVVMPTHFPLHELMRQAGYETGYPGPSWRGCLPAAERRLAELQKRRDDAQHQLAQVTAAIATTPTPV